MRPGREKDYRSWVEQVLAAAQAHAGFVSAVRLGQAGGLHHLVLQFADPAAARDWRGQDRYVALARQADGFSVGLDQHDDGTVAAFDLPSEAAARKWKTAIVTWIGVVPTLLVVSGAIGWAFPGLPRIVQQILSSVLLTATLTWVILPRVRSWSRFWMLQDGDGALRKTPG